MPRTRIKICGITNPDHALAAAAAGADYIGLVFVEKSPRYLTPTPPTVTPTTHPTTAATHPATAAAAAITAALPPRIEPVGLFADADAATIETTAAAVGLGTIQLHGNEKPDLLARLAHLRFFKALHFTRDRFLQALAIWRNAPDNLDAILCDTPPTRNAHRPGGSGCTFDWQALRDQLDTLPPAARPRLILAGGLSPDNVAQAIRLVRPYGVDVSTGVESAPGVKDPARIKAFCQAVQQADRDLV